MRFYCHIDNYNEIAKRTKSVKFFVLACLLSLFFVTASDCMVSEASLQLPDYYQGSNGIWEKHKEYRINEENKYNSLNYIVDLSKKAELDILSYSGFSCHNICLSVSKLVQEECASGRIMVSDCGTDKKNEALLMFVGDFMCLKGQQYSAEVKDGYDFRPSFEMVKPIFDSADFVCGNLETLISESNPLTKKQVTENGQPQCNGPIEYLDALRYAGVDAVVTANNHCCDWGSKGVKETKKHLDDYKFANVGTNYDENDTAFIMFNINDINVAVLSYSHIINQRGKMTPYDLSTMIHCYDEVKMKNDIASAKEAGAEYIVVYMHWGVENTENLNWYQTNDSVAVANAGADLIIGSHPHCLQKSEYIKTSDGRNVLCMYSMGNFVSSMSRDINNDTIILRVEIKKNRKKNTVSTKSVSIIPCNVTSRNGHNNVIVPDVPELNGKLQLASLNSSYSRITKILSKLQVYIGN